MDIITQQGLSDVFLTWESQNAVQCQMWTCNVMLAKLRNKQVGISTCGTKVFWLKLWKETEKCDV